MDGNNFDDLTRKLGGLASRRQAVAGMIGAAAAAAGLSASAKTKSKNSKKKGKGKSNLSPDMVKQGHGLFKSACGGVGCQGCSNGAVFDPVDNSCPNVPNNPGGTPGVPVCLPGTTFDQCGTGGAVCQSCNGSDVCIPILSAGGQVNGGQCGNFPAQCAFNIQCALVVNGVVTCQDAGGPTVCGSTTDFACLPPCPSGQECIESDNNPPFDFFCSTTTCKNSCPNGCCIGPNDPFGRPEGNCVAGATDSTACGTGGVTCTNCLAVCGLASGCRPGGICDCLEPPPCGLPNQACCTTGTPCLGSNVCTNGLCEAAPPPACSSTTCPAGCCDSAGNCVTSQSTSACGINGAACVACTGKHQKCKNGVCKKKKHH